jgi:hypothetical protein
MAAIYMREETKYGINFKGHGLDDFICIRQVME